MSLESCWTRGPMRCCRTATARPLSLHVAAAEGSVVVAMLLLDRLGADGLTLCDHARQLPLHRPVVHGHEQLVRLLLSRGALSNALIG